MIPNKTDEQILYQHFKYYDLDSSGYCTLQNFIKTNDRIGVVMPNIKDFETVFNYFADSDTSMLYYKKFVHEIFNFSSIKRSKSPKKNEKYDNLPFQNSNDFISVISEKLISMEGPFSLLELIKNLQMIDFEGNKRITSDDFYKAIKRSKINMKSNEFKLLFQNSDFIINGVIRYQILINMLIDLFWNEKKNNLSENIFCYLTNNGRKPFTINDMKNYFENILEDSIEKNSFLKFIDEYKLINKNYSNQYLQLKDIILFLKHYGFGQKDSSFLENIVELLEPDVEDKKDIKRNNYINNYNDNDDFYNDFNDNNYYNKKNKNSELNRIFEKIREQFIKFGRKSFFNFIKHFKYYDNNINSNTITKYNFAKVLKDFNVILSVDEIEYLFSEFASDYNIMNYDKFLDNLITNFSNKNRIKIIEFIFSTIEERATEFKRNIDLTFLKEVYNPKRNFFQKEEAENRMEFDECLELYLFFYKGAKSERFTLQNFVEFYKFISFLMYSDNNFITMISNEWRVPSEYIPQELINSNNNNENINNEYQDDADNDNYCIKKNEEKITLNKKDFGITDDQNENYPPKSKLIQRLINNDFDNYNNENPSLDLLTKKLFNRGLRGILYLHLEFINTCQDLNKISLEDFIEVCEIQHLNLNKNDYINIFNSFKNENNFLDFPSFIRNFKKELKDNKLNCIENAFENFNEEKISFNQIKKKYKAFSHPDVVSGKKTEEEKILEFLDCFNINFEILNMDNQSAINGNGTVDFEIFANFYEYVAFIYPNDDVFRKVVESEWL